MVFEGVDGLFHGFAHTTQGDYEAVTGGFGRMGDGNARVQALSMRHHGAPLYPLSLARARGIKAGEIKEMVCEIAEAPCIACGSRLPARSDPPMAMPRNSRRLSYWRPALCAAALALRLSPSRPCATRHTGSWSKVRYVIDPIILIQQFHRTYPCRAQ